MEQLFIDVIGSIGADDESLKRWTNSQCPLPRLPPLPTPSITELCAMMALASCEKKAEELGSVIIGKKCTHRKDLGNLSADTLFPPPWFMIAKVSGIQLLSYLRSAAVIAQLTNDNVKEFYLEFGKALGAFDPAITLERVSSFSAANFECKREK